ncbi:MAG: Y-family DNA polymerase [Steroidobacteraceae bacterium]
MSTRTTPTRPEPARDTSATPAPIALASLAPPRQLAAQPLLEARELWIGAHFAQLAQAPLSARVSQPRLRGREQGLLLERLAVRAQRFTPHVSLVPPDGLLLEVKGSLHLFGGASKLGAAWLAECRAIGARPTLALAPTALAALAGARFTALAGQREAWPGMAICDEARLVGSLAPLPLEVLRWSPEVIERLSKVGVRTIGAALRLPRAGFARRFGVETLASLDRLVGRAADPRPVFHARERFRMRRALNYELEQQDTILTALTPLLESLGKFLAARQCGITELECRLWHRHAPATRCLLELVAPAADPERLKALLGERLAAVRLPEPVRSCELRSGRLVPREPDAGALWQPGEHGGDRGGGGNGGVSMSAHTESTNLIESLRARLGPEAVHGLGVHPTHRPEAASRRVELGAVEMWVWTSEWMSEQTSRQTCGRTKGSLQGPGSPRMAPTPWPAFRRPAWLLPVPQLLSEEDGLPRRQGSLRLLGEPERIETGWWEGEVARDYYCAVDAHGVRLWVFREREEPHRWFLQGVFG